MAKKTYTEEFRIEAVKQVTHNGYEIVDTAHRLGVHPDSLKAWIKRLESPISIAVSKSRELSNTEIKKLKNELKRVKKERDILKKAAMYFASYKK